MAPKDPFEPRRKPVQERARATVDAIIQATAQVLVTEGYQNATTNRIAEVAGVSIGTLYQYFPNKASLLVALIDDNIEEGLKEMTHNLGNLWDAHPRHTIPRVIEVYVGRHAAELELRQELLEHIPSIKLFEKMRQITAATQPAIRAYLEHHKDKLAHQDLDMAAFMVVTTVQAATESSLLQRPHTILDGTLLKHQIHLVMNYLLEDPHGTA